MPQMSPLSWLTLFIIFSITLMIFNIKNYFCFSYSLNQIPQKFFIKQSKMNWKW